MEMAGITLRDDSAQELKPSRIQKDNSDLSQIISELENTLNPFSVHDDALYCLNTGKAVCNDVKYDLLLSKDKGSEWHQQFVKECKEDPGRFEKAVKRRKVKNFTYDAVKAKITPKDKKVKEVKCTRDLFGRLLYLAVSQKLDLGLVLSYPLNEVPLALFSITGDMNKTSKSALMEKLEEMGKTNELPNEADAYIIDAMFFIRTLDLPSTFGGVAMTILQQACSNGEVVHLVCDTYPEGPTLKDSEHDLRGHSEITYRITGPSQKRPVDLNSALRSSQFKKELIAFLKDEWTSQEYAPILQGHQLYFAIDQECYQYTADDGKMYKRQIHELNSGHDEADTRMIFHASFVAGMCHDNTPVVVIRSIDTDVFVLMLHHARFLDAQLGMDTGVN